MSDPQGSDRLPISWDEARELLVVVLLISASVRMLSRLSGFIEERWGAFSDDLAELVSGASATTGLLVLGAGVIVATTPPSDVVPRLRTATIVVAAITVVQAAVGILLGLTRVTGSGVFGRMEPILDRPVPALLLAGTGWFLAARVVPFED